jgi:hypothetical protein
MAGELTQEDLAALGRMALASTGIQLAVESMIWELLGVDEPAGRAVTENASPAWLVGRLKLLAKRSGLDPELAQEVAKYADDAKRMFDFRNDNLHNVWTALEEGTAIRLRSVLIDGKEGPVFATDYAVAHEGLLPLLAGGMEWFVRHGLELLDRLRGARA